MNVYEVFLKRDGKEEFRHAGILEAPNDELAVVLARENYARRAEGRTMWLVDRKHLLIADEEFIAPNADKPQRHNDGSRVAALRKAAREAGAE